MCRLSRPTSCGKTAVQRVDLWPLGPEAALQHEVEASKWRSCGGTPDENRPKMWVCSAPEFCRRIKPEQSARCESNPRAWSEYAAYLRSACSAGAPGSSGCGGCPPLKRNSRPDGSSWARQGRHGWRRWVGQNAALPGCWWQPGRSASGLSGPAGRQWTSSVPTLTTEPGRRKSESGFLALNL